MTESDGCACGCLVALGIILMLVAFGLFLCVVFGWAFVGI